MKKLFIIAIVGALAGGVVQVAASNMKSAEYRGVGMDKGSKPSTMSSNKTTTTTTTTGSGSLKSGSITASTRDSTTVTITAPTIPSEPSTGVGWMTDAETDDFFGPEEAQPAPGLTDSIDHGAVPQGEPEAERAGQ